MGWTLAGRSARACGRRIRVLVDQIRRSVSSVGRVFNPARHNYKLLDSTQPNDRLNPRLTLSVDRRTVMRSIWCVSLRRICNSFTATRRTTLCDRAFSVTAARAWNAFPLSVRSAPSLLQFRRRDLKTALSQSSYSSPWCPAV